MQTAHSAMAKQPSAGPGTVPLTAALCRTACSPPLQFSSCVIHSLPTAAKYISGSDPDEDLHFVFFFFLTLEFPVKFI